VLYYHKGKIQDKEVLNVKKLNKDYTSMDNSVEAYACGCGCSCTCPQGCGTSSYVSYVANDGTNGSPRSSLSSSTLN
jgi:putative bacteriocin precursor